MRRPVLPSSSFRRPGLLRCVAGMVLGLASLTAGAEGHLYRLASRQAVTTSVYWEAREGAKATVLLFPGGGGGFGKIENGKPTSNNFLVRSVEFFLANRFNVAIFGRTGDGEALDYADRISEQHLGDVRAVLEFVKTQGSVPVWIVGTSAGTVSATATAIKMHDPAIAGLVLTSSVVNFQKTGAVPTQDLAAITLPVLVLHHAKDACGLCRPSDVPYILRGLKNARIKKEIMVDGGANPTGDVCAALHWHGFIGMEKEAVDLIGDWIRQVAP